MGVNLQWFIRSDAAPRNDGVTVICTDLATKYLQNQISNNMKGSSLVQII